MRIFSATQAVSPAIERTKQFLFQDFEIRTYLKLAAVACISEGFTANIIYATGHHFATTIGPEGRPHLSDEMIAILVLAIVAFLALGVILFYLVSCFRFVFFHCLLHETKEIRPVWNRYRPQAIRYFNGGLMVWIVFAVVGALIGLPFLPSLYRLFQSSRNGLEVDDGSFFALFLPMLLIGFIGSGLAFVINLVLHDFVLPHMALENASFGNAWKAARGHIAAQKASFAAYCFLRLLLPAVTLLGLLIFVGIPLGIIFGTLTMSANGFLEMIDDPTPLGMVFHTVFQILFTVLGVAVGLIVEFGLGGPVATWVRSYALLYYGGRYKVLGEQLSHPPAPAIEGTAEIA
jgi:hypothetical protein